MKTGIAFKLLIIASVILFSCSKQNEQTLQKTSGFNCDTLNMTYTANVKPILQTSCYSCHATAIASGGVILDTYAGVNKEVGNGMLIGTITHAAGYSEMPLLASKLSDCSINSIRAWINHGALNN